MGGDAATNDGGGDANGRGNGQMVVMSWQ